MMDRSVSISSRLAFFLYGCQACFIVCWGTPHHVQEWSKCFGHRLEALGAESCRFTLRVGLELAWNHATLHLWHERLYSKIQSCSPDRANSSDNIRVRYLFARSALRPLVLKWSLQGIRSHGRPHNAWDDHLRDWTAAAQSSLFWMSLTCICCSWRIFVARVALYFIGFYYLLRCLYNILSTLRPVNFIPRPPCYTPPHLSRRRADDRARSAGWVGCGMRCATGFTVFCTLGVP